ncbi:hypothetical protein E4U17_001904, partial [Claviceps sp. LM77 group G4]
ILSSGVDVKATDQILNDNLGLLTPSPERTPFEDSYSFQESRSLPDPLGSISSSSVLGRIVDASEGPGSSTQVPCDDAISEGDDGDDLTSGEGLDARASVQASGEITPTGSLATAGLLIVDPLSSSDVRGVSVVQDKTPLATDLSVPGSAPDSAPVLDSSSSSTQPQPSVRGSARIQKKKGEGQSNRVTKL